MINSLFSHHAEAFQGQPTFWGVYQAYKSECAQVYKKAGWAEGTTAAYDSYIERLILPNLQHHNQKAISHYTLQDFEEVLLKVQAKGQGKSGEPYKAYDLKTLSQLRALMRAVITVASNHYLCENVF